METFEIKMKNSKGETHLAKSSYKSVQRLVDFLQEKPQYNFAGYVEFNDGIKIKGVSNENHFKVVYGHYANRCFFIGRGQGTWEGIYNFGNCQMLDPDNPENKLLKVLPTIKL